MLCVGIVAPAQEIRPRATVVASILENDTYPDIYSVPSDFNQQNVCCAGLPNGSSCATGDFCISNICSSRICTGRPVGAVCTVNGMCQNNICTVRGAEGRCTLKLPGAVCGADAECASSSCPAGVCQCSASCTFNPASCAQGCSLPSTCIVLPQGFADYCGEKKANGGPCRFENECLSGLCNAGFCTSTIPGASCASLSEWA